MLKNALIFSATLLLFSGCVERGYKLTVDKTTGTVTAIKSIDIRKDTKDTSKTDIDKMQKAVKKEQTRGKPMSRSADKTENTEKVEKTQLEARVKTEEDKRLLNTKEKNEREALKRKLDKERNLEQFTKDELEKKEQEKEATEAKRKQAEAKRVQLVKDDQSKLAQYLAQYEEEEELLAINEREAKEAHEKEVAKAKRLKEVRVREAKKALLLTTQGLTFKPSRQVYQKFGTSEIHGHVIYLSSDGVEIFLKNTKIYLVAQNTKMDHWYTNFYLKNSHDSTQTQSIVNYMNATKLNLERNFAFYGLAPGNYYVVIESDYPKSMTNNKKVYIAKKITVEKYKKIMTVFSKKL